MELSQLVNLSSEIVSTVNAYTTRGGYSLIYAIEVYVKCEKSALFNHLVD